MKHLNYQTLQDLNYDGYLLNEARNTLVRRRKLYARICRFFIDKMNETANFNSKFVLVQPIPKFTTRMEILSMNSGRSTHCIYVVPKTDRKSLPNG